MLVRENNEIVSRVLSAQHLGIIVSDNLSWNEHVNNICKKANSTLGLLRRILNGCNPKVKVTTYHTPIRPKLQSTHAALCLICFNDYSSFSHVSPMLECLGWDSLKDSRLLLQASLFYKICVGDVAILFPAEVRPLTRVKRSPNHHPFHQLSISIYSALFQQEQQW